MRSKSRFECEWFSVNDLEELFDSKNVEGIAAKLLAMQQSLKLLVNIADYEDRKLQLAELKNRLEAIASPSVVLAFTTNNTGKIKTKTCTCLFNQI